MWFLLEPIAFLFFSLQVYLKMIPQVGQTSSRSPKGKVMQSFIAQLQIHCCTCGLALEVQTNAKEWFRKGDDRHCHGKCKQMTLGERGQQKLPWESVSIRSFGASSAAWLHLEEWWQLKILWAAFNCSPDVISCGSVFFHGCANSWGKKENKSSVHGSSV